MNTSEMNLLYFEISIHLYSSIDPDGGPSMTDRIKLYGERGEEETTSYNNCVYHADVVVDDDDDGDRNTDDRGEIVLSLAVCSVMLLSKHTHSEREMLRVTCLLVGKRIFG